MTAGAANRAGRRSGVSRAPLPASGARRFWKDPGGGARAGAMSGLLHTTLSGLNSDSYCEISQYRDQHFRVRRRGGVAGPGRGGEG